MFGFPTRAEATTNTMIKQMTEMLRRQWGDLPSHVWRDPYVVRYMQILICGILKINSQGKLSGEELGMPAARIWFMRREKIPRRSCGGRQCSERTF